MLHLGHNRLEIRMSDSVSDTSKPSDQFDNSETKIRNRETCLKAAFTVRVLFTRLLLLIIDTCVNVLLYLRNRVID